MIWAYHDICLTAVGFVKFPFQKMKKKKKNNIFFNVWNVVWLLLFLFSQMNRMWSVEWSSWSVRILTKKGNDENVFNFGLGEPRKYHIIQFQMFRYENNFWIFLSNISYYSEALKQSTTKSRRAFLLKKSLKVQYIFIAQSRDYRIKCLSKSIDIQKK